MSQQSEEDIFDDAHRVEVNDDGIEPEVDLLDKDEAIMARTADLVDLSDTDYVTPHDQHVQASEDYFTFDDSMPVVKRSRGGAIDNLVQSVKKFAHDVNEHPKVNEARQVVEEQILPKLKELGEPGRKPRHTGEIHKMVDTNLSYLTRLLDPRIKTHREGRDMIYEVRVPGLSKDDFSAEYYPRKEQLVLVGVSSAENSSRTINLMIAREHLDNVKIAVSNGILRVVVHDSVVEPETCPERIPVLIEGDERTDHGRRSEIVDILDDEISSR